MKKLILLFAFLFIATVSFTQLTEVLYKIEYNETTDFFDCKLYIENGIATSAADRMQLPAQYSIVVETGIAITIEETFFPLYNNESYTGTIPMDWSIENTAINPIEFSGYDVFAIVPNVGAQPSHYNNLSVENEITLFSLSAVGGDICSVSLRVFENDDDPNNIGSTDFTNSMMIGTANEIYEGNDVASGVSGAVDVTINQGEICEGECIILTPTFNCIFPGLEYIWSTGETTESITVCPETSTVYTLNLSGPFEFSKQIPSYISVDIGIWADGDLVTDLCIGVPVYYLPETGIWSSSDDNIVTVTNEGYVTPISVGSATISHTTDSGDCLDEIVVTVLDPEPPTIIGDVEICEGETTQLSPSTGVAWVSGNPEIATVDNTGLVTGVGLGSTVFIYTTDQGCVSEPTSTVNVLIIPEPKITGLDTICRSSTTTLTPNAGVSWESSDPSIAKIDNSGNVTGVSEGSTTFYFTDMANGCTSDESEPVTVLPSPIVQLYIDSICQGMGLDVGSNSQDGQWIITIVSGSPNAATITSYGTVESEEPGVVNVQYISKDGCYSDENLLTILPKPVAIISSNSPICIGENLILSTTSPPGSNYSYLWTEPSGVLSNKANIIIPNASLSDSGLYTLVASENGCVSDEIHQDVLVADCDPCDDDTAISGWNKKPVSANIFSSVGDYEIGSSLVTGRELEDFVYYNYSAQDVRLIKNTGSEFFEEEIVLFELPYYGSKVKIDIVDIDQDGLKDIITYQSKTSSSTSNLDTLLFTIFNNKDNFIFENKLSVVGESGLGFSQHPVVYKDLDKQGFLDIIPYYGSIYFTENWEYDSIQMSVFSTSILVEDINEDGYLDILRNNGELFINNGDRTFDLTMTDGVNISDPGLYDTESGVFYNGYLLYQITKGDNPFVELCSDPFLEGSNGFFYANINSSSNENGIIVNLDGFNIFQNPLTCENYDDYDSNFDFKPKRDGKIDLTENGYTDFITVENGTIFAWINPKDLPKIRGIAFIDNNGDGILNENDSPLRNVLISITPGDFSVLTDDNGNYQFAVTEGLYTLTANVNEGEWVMDELTIENVEITDPCNLGYDFGFVPDPTALPMVNLSMVNTIARCDFEVKFTITVENTGTEPLVSQLQFEFDDKTTFFSSEIPGASVIGNKVTADIGPLAPFQPQKYVVKVKMPNGSSVLPLLGFKSTLSNEIGEIIAEYGYEEQLRCSYDPNDKREFPDREGDKNLTLMDEDIEYTIRFQNNGNDTAYNVKIVDPLDGNIKPASIRVVGSSHGVETCIEGTDLIFLFEDIYLVDSTTNYAASQGYVTFKCNAKAGRAEYTPVNNSADIFFDTNLPISTNQTLNTLVSELCTNKSTIIDKYICDGEEYLGHTQSGTYTESFELPYGCDSLVTINLSVQGITYSQQSIDACGAQEITINSEVYFIESNTTITDTIVNDLGCISNILIYEITVIPDLIFLESIEFCINEFGLSPTTLSGLWLVDDVNVVSVDYQGTMTAINVGTTTVHFLDEETGCTDMIQVEVFPEPIIGNNGIDQICISATNQLTSDTDGDWSSSDPAIATITNDGLVLGNGAGNVTFTFISFTTGCDAVTSMSILPLNDSSCIVSTDELTSESINLYPNPASRSVFIESAVEWKALRLMNAQGQLIKNGFGKYVPTKQIDLEEMMPGLYFIVIETAVGVLVKRFVVD